VSKGKSHAAAVGRGGPPVVKVSDVAAGILKYDFNAFDPSFTGGVRVAVGDVNGDGVPDIIVGQGPGGQSLVRVFDGNPGQLIGTIAPFGTFRGGVFVATGDVNGDGYSDIIMGADAGGGPDVEVFSGKDGTRLYGFYAFPAKFAGGVRVAAGDLKGNGYADVIAGAGPGADPDVEAFNGPTGSRIGGFYAYKAAFRGGIFVAAGDVNGDGKADIITGADAGGGPHVQVFDGSQVNPMHTPPLLDSFYAYDPSFTGGARVSAMDLNGDGRTEIITGAGPGGAPHLRIFDGVTGQQLTTSAYDSFFVFATTMSTGIYVGGH